jgi:SNF2 family DNA or RNA helicase
MGQERPVTVYRLIMKNTIEEKIIKLHKDKRDLADDLLSDGAMSSKMTEEELLNLIAV